METIIMNIEFNLHPRIKQAIGSEREIISSYTASDILGLIKGGKISRATGHQFFFSTVLSLEEVANSIVSALENAPTQPLIEFATYMAIGLQSALTTWHVDTIQSKEKSKALALRYRAALERKDAKKFLAVLAQEAHDRYVTEGRSGDEAITVKERILENPLVAYIDQIVAEIQGSSLYNYSISLTNPLEAKTVWGNDFAAFLNFALFSGASFQTTNPPLINTAWNLDPAGWKSKAEDLWKAIEDIGTPSLSPSERKVSTITMAIVEENCRRVRDLYLFSEGRVGFICYQVNPKHNNDTQKMVDEIRFVHKAMTHRLGHGFEPNISFKVPGTLAALEAAKILGKEGISLTITLCFSVFQALAFAKVFATSTAAVNSVVIMNGRLAFPVRDHLLANFADQKDTLKESSKYIGVDVTRHLYEHLYKTVSEGGLGLNPKRVRIMNASLRIYGDNVPDVLETWGSPSITIFPNVRYALNLKDRVYNDRAVQAPFDSTIRTLNAQSEMFRQSWWVEGDGPEVKPEVVLDLETTDPKDILTWVPIAETLNQFVDSYEQATKLAAWLQ